MQKMACLTGWHETFGNSLHAYNIQHTKRHSLLWENRKQTEVGVKWSKIISRSSILHWRQAIGWTQKECRMPRYLKSLALGQAAGFYHIPIRSVGQHRSRHFQHINRLSTQPSKIFPMFLFTLSLGGYVAIYVTLGSREPFGEIRTKLGKVKILPANCDNIERRRAKAMRRWCHQMMIARSTDLLPELHFLHLHEMTTKYLSTKFSSWVSLSWSGNRGGHWDVDKNITSRNYSW